jgi:hypothetical protein
MNYMEHFIESLDSFCEDCTNYGTQDCKGRKCNVGFARYVVQYAKDNAQPVLEGGEHLIPKKDMRYYDEINAAHSVATICRLCKDCNENHSEACIISLARQSLESTQIKDMVKYPGNVLGYLLNLSKESPIFAQLVRNEYQNF